MNLILFGGAFDPIHLGHLNMAKRASEALDAKVVFIPAKVAVWKKETAPIKDKIKMIELSIKDFHLDDIASISHYEADSKQDINYSIDTVKYYKSVYPNDNLYLLIGQDQVFNFHKWKDAKEISKLVRIVYFGRLNEELSQKNIEEFNMMRIEGEINDINSTDIRALRNYRLSY